MYLTRLHFVQRVPIIISVLQPLRHFSSKAAVQVGGHVGWPDQLRNLERRLQANFKIGANQLQLLADLGRESFSNFRQDLKKGVYQESMKTTENSDDH